jgi:Holliday junction resolvasome RuvABC endonuclease subunit
VIIEEYAFSRHSARAHELGELGGVVKLELMRAGVPFRTYQASAARKLLGKAPRKDPKRWAHNQLIAAGAPAAWTGDQLDAFLQANQHLSFQGDALMLPQEAA